MRDEYEADDPAAYGPAGDDGGDAPASEAGAPDAPARESVASQQHRLRDAMRRARLNEAERRDVIESLRESELARLEVLQDGLADVFTAVPEDSDLFEGAILPGNPPRLWIDILAYIVMARDKRTYQFVQEARYGRRTLYETTSAADMARRVTDYVANRILERERAMADDMHALMEKRAQDKAPAEDAGPLSGKEPEAEAAPPAVSPAATMRRAAARLASDEDAGADHGGPSTAVRVLLAFLLGALAGAAVLFLYGASYVPA